MQEYGRIIKSGKCISGFKGVGGTRKLAVLYALTANLTYFYIKIIVFIENVDKMARIYAETVTIRTMRLKITALRV